MKAKLITGMAVFGLMVSSGFLAQAETSKAAPKSAKGVDVYTVDPKPSELKWIGRKVTGSHNGTVNIKSGEIQVANNTIADGMIVIDMPSIKVLDLTDPGANAKLTNHLKSDDFFGVDKFPTAAFDITEVKPIAEAKAGGPTHQITGNLMVKGKTHPSSFPATVSMKDGTLQATASGINIDRTLYDIRYGSGKFFQNLGDKMIYDDFTIDFKIVAKK